MKGVSKSTPRSGYSVCIALTTQSFVCQSFVQCDMRKNGVLYINRTPADPFQGYQAGWKRSGLGGSDGDGKLGMLEFTQTRQVVMAW